MIPTKGAARAAVPTSAGAGATIADNLLFSPLNAAGDAAYPITAPSWVIVYAKQTDAAKGGALKAYLKYLLTDGQAQLTGLDFAPLPKRLQEKALTQLDQLKVP